MLVKNVAEERMRVPARFEVTVSRLTTELKEVNRHLVFAELPEKTLEALSEAIDHLRATVWAVLNSMVDEFSDGQRTVIVLTSHRLQRAKALLAALEEEMAAGRLTGSTAGVGELRVVLEVVYKKLHRLCTGQVAPPEPA